jgi:hypothetical protein
MTVNIAGIKAEPSQAGATTTLGLSPFNQLAANAWSD